MLVVLLYMEYYCASDLDFGQEVEVSQDEEALALVLKELTHVVLVNEEVIVEIHVSRPVISVSVLIVADDIVFPERTVSEGENLIVHLDDEDWEVNVR